MWTSGSCGSSKSVMGVSDPSLSRWWMRARCWRIDGVNVNAVLVGPLKTDTGKYGRKLDVAIPQNLQNVAGIIITLTQFTTRVAGTAKGTPYVALKGCSGGKLSFKGDFFYTDNTNKSALNTANCRAS